MSAHLDDGIVREVIKKHNEIEEQERRQAMEEVVDRWNAKQSGNAPKEGDENQGPANPFGIPDDNESLKREADRMASELPDK